MDTLSSGRADIDGNGSPNLSNIAVTYNHLGGNVNPNLSNYLDCSILPTGVCGQNMTEYELPRIGDVVLTGTPLGQTGGDPDFDHLHLEVWFARGYLRPNSGADNSLNLNPFLMYSTTTFEQHKLQFYFPRELPGRPIKSSLGVVEGELTNWSQGTFNIASAVQYSFFATQTTDTPGVEWPYDMAPLSFGAQLSFTELMEYLPELYSTYPYQDVNCTVSNDPSRNPPRQIAACDLSDLKDDSTYIPISHNN
jgi:hypothetical protein